MSPEIGPVQAVGRLKLLAHACSVGEWIARPPPTPASAKFRIEPASDDARPPDGASPRQPNRHPQLCSPEVSDTRASPVTSAIPASLEQRQAHTASHFFAFQRFCTSRAPGGTEVTTHPVTAVAGLCSSPPEQTSSGEQHAWAASNRRGFSGRIRVIDRAWPIVDSAAQQSGLR